MPFAATARESQQARVLCVESDPQLRSSLVNAIRAGGYEVRAARTVHEALDLIYREPVDLVVARHPVPSLHGVALPEVFHAEGVRTPVVVLSATDVLGDGVAVADDRWGTHRLQPIESRPLMKAIERALAGSKRGPRDRWGLVDPWTVPAAARAEPDRHPPVILESLNVEEAERRLIAAALERCNDNRTAAAQLLGIHVRTLRRKLKTMRTPLAVAGA